MAKHEPIKGERIYLRRYTGNYWVDECHYPYTVVDVNPQKTICYVQEAELIFKGLRYYDTLPDEIRENPNGKIKKLRYSDKKQRWQESPADSYPLCAVFCCGWDYQPYLN